MEGDGENGPNEHFKSLRDGYASKCISIRPDKHKRNGSAECHLINRGEMSIQINKRRKGSTSQVTNKNRMFPASYVSIKQLVQVNLGEITMEASKLWELQNRPIRQRLYASKNSRSTRNFFIVEQ